MLSVSRRTKEEHTFSLTSSVMQASASMLRLLSTSRRLLQRRSWMRMSRQLVRLASSLQHFGSLLSWSRQVAMPRWLPAWKYLARADSSRVFGSDIAVSWWRDINENRADICELRDIIVSKSHRPMHAGGEDTRTFVSSFCVACCEHRLCTRSKILLLLAHSCESFSGITKRSRVD